MTYLFFMLLLSVIALLEVSIHVKDTSHLQPYQIAGYGKIYPNQERIEFFLTLGVLLLSTAGFVFIINNI